MFTNCYCAFQIKQTSPRLSLLVQLCCEHENLNVLVSTELFFFVLSGNRIREVEDTATLQGKHKTQNCSGNRAPQRMPQMKVICGEANAQCASISTQGRLSSRQSLVNDGVLIGFQCLGVPLDTEWSVRTES